MGHPIFRELLEGFDAVPVEYARSVGNRGQANMEAEYMAKAYSASDEDYSVFEKDEEGDSLFDRREEEGEE